MTSTSKSAAATTILSGLGMVSKGFRAAEHTAMATHTSTTTSSAHASEPTIVSVLSVAPQTLLSDTVASYIVAYNKAAPVDYFAIHWALGLATTAGAGATLARPARKTTLSPADMKPKRWKRIARWLDKKLRTDAKLRKELCSAKRLIEEENDNLQTRSAPTDDASDVEDFEENSQFGDILQAYDDSSAYDDSEVVENELKRVRSENASLRKQLHEIEEARTSDQQMLDQLRREQEAAQARQADLLHEIQQSRDLDTEQTEEIAESNKEREDLQKQLEDKIKQLNEETQRRQRAERKLKELQGSNTRLGFFSRMANLVSTPRSKPSSAQGSPGINASPPRMSSPLANRDKPVGHRNSLPHVPLSSPPPATEEHASTSGVSPTKNLITNQAVSTPQDTSNHSSIHKHTDEASVKSYFKAEVAPEEFNARMKEVDLPRPLAKRPRDGSNSIETPRPAKRLQTDRSHRRSRVMSPGLHRQAQKASVLTPSGGPAIKLRMPGRQQASIQPTEAPEGSNVVGTEQNEEDFIDLQAATSHPGPSNAVLDNVAEEDEVMTDGEIQAAIGEATRPSPSPAKQAPANDDVDMAEPEQPTMQPPQSTPAPEAVHSDTEMHDNDTAPAAHATSKRAPQKLLIPTTPTTVRKSSRLAFKAPVWLNERAFASRSVSPQKTDAVAAPSASKRKAPAPPASFRPQGIAKAPTAQGARAKSPVKKR